jgi:hypothetical protein
MNVEAAEESEASHTIMIIYLSIRCTTGHMGGIKGPISLFLVSQVAKTCITLTLLNQLARHVPLQSPHPPPLLRRLLVRFAARRRLLLPRLHRNLHQSLRRGLHQGHHPRVLRGVRRRGPGRPQLRRVVQERPGGGVHEHRHVLVPVQRLREQLQVVRGAGRGHREHVLCERDEDRHRLGRY